LIALVGEQLQLGPGQFLDPTSLSFAGGSGNEDGQQSGFNDLGQVAFFAEGSNNVSGIFISNVAAVPEPASVFLLGAGAIVIAATVVVNRRRQRRHFLLLADSLVSA